MRAIAGHHPGRGILRVLLVTALLSGATGCTRIIGTGRVRCHYMMYACGECAPQFRVDSVLAGPLHALLEQDIQLTLDGSTAFVDSLDCLICWTFIAEGTARKRGSTYILDAVRVERRLQPDCCQH